MSVFGRGRRIGSPPIRFKIKITTEDGDVLYWHKRGKLHTVEEDVADVFVEHFNPQIFQVRPDGTLTPPVAGETAAVRRVEKEPA